MSLTQMEAQQIQEAIKFEGLCSSKYAAYGEQLQDQELKNLFKQLENRENQHKNTLTQILQQNGITPENN